MNILIEKWKQSAKAIYDLETIKMKSYEIEERTFTYSKLAEMQIQSLEETKPDKNKPLLEQLNETQKEAYEYLKKVVETNEL